jgi:hypothetical protein
MFEDNESSVVPVIEGAKCKALLHLIYYSLKLSPYIIGAFFWYKISFLVGIGMVLFVLLITGIITSKMRIASVPVMIYQEDLSDFEICRWFVSYNLCNK